MRKILTAGNAPIGTAVLYVRSPPRTLLWQQGVWKKQVNHYFQHQCHDE